MDFILPPFPKQATMSFDGTTLVLMASPTWWGTASHKAKHDQNSNRAEKFALFLSKTKNGKIQKSRDSCRILRMKCLCAFCRKRKISTKNLFHSAQDNFLLNIHKMRQDHFTLSNAAFTIICHLFQNGGAVGDYMLKRLSLPNRRMEGTGKTFYLIQPSKRIEVYMYRSK